MLPSFCQQSITVIRPGTKTLRGSTVPDWENSKSTTLGGCSVQPATSSLDTDGRVLGIEDGLTVYVPNGSDVQAGDRIEYDGETYEIYGEPRVWVSATGLRNHIQLNLRRYVG